MAAYTVYLVFSGGKGASMKVGYPNSTTFTGTGHASSSPLDLQIGDTVTFDAGVSGNGPGYVTVSGLNIFTSNSNFNVSFSGNILGYPTTKTLTVATGATLLDSITTTQQSTLVTDTFHFERQGVTTYSVTSGAISMDGVRDFLTTSSNSAISMSQFYRGGSLVQTAGNSGVPASGAIDLADLYGVAKPD